MKRQRGFSLTELLVATVIGLFLIAATFSVLGVSSASVRSTGQMTQLQEAARLALRLVEEDLTQAGFFSDLSAIDLSPNTNTTLHGSVAGVDCVGKGMNNGTFPNGVGHFRTLWAAQRGSQPAISCETAAREGSDVLQLKRLRGNVVNGSLVSNRFYALLNLNELHFFTGQQVPPPIAGGRIYEYQHRVYYVKNNADSVPTLYRHSLSSTALMGVAEPLVEGVEMMRFEFGIDSNGDSVVDAYLKTSEVTDSLWDQHRDAEIISVQVHLLLRAFHQDGTFQTGMTRTYPMPGGTVSVPDDGYRRKQVSTTVVIRNPWLKTTGETP
ncbi:PilW family protein [Luminiphilus sp.]|nr:PilW family protein [Luminiphilus sp.]